VITGAPLEWQIRDWIREGTNGLAKSYEVDALRSHVDRLECSLREARAEIDGLRNELQTVAQGVTQVTEIASGMLDRINSEPSGDNP
jgi:predicted RNase H-like nuclease (RuvC/YqgF family)